tara:strand:+ start:932 stop:1447 length:516 start_codon:yes stop_codon:yes gene_type:complete
LKRYIAVNNNSLIKGLIFTRRKFFKKVIVWIGMAINWNLYKNFTSSEWQCKCCDDTNVNPDFVAKIQELRDRCGFALPITSGVRCPKNNSVSNGHKNSAHLSTTPGGACAVDLGVQSSVARIVLQHALEMDCFDGIGISQRGSKFLHLDMKPRGEPDPKTGKGPKVLWSYA